MNHRVFVSHVNGDPATELLLTPLCAALDEAGCDVLVDKTQLRAGAAWRQEIYAWLGLCHSAVVLISRQALDDAAKYWVARETALLIWRRALDPSLRLIPVLLPDVTLLDLGKGRFADLLMHEIQCVDASAAHQDTIDRVKQGLLTQGSIYPATTQLGDMAEQLATRLRDLDTRAVVTAGQMLGVDLGRWRPDGDACRELALSLLCAPFDDAANALDYLAGFAGPAALEGLLSAAQILGANWVDPEAARWLAFDLLDKRAAAVNASTQFAAEAYVQRACGRPPPARWPIIPLTGVTGEEEEEEMRAEIDAALARAMPLTPDVFGGDPVLRRGRLLEQRAKRGLPTFLLARLPPDPSTLLRTLHTHFPTLAAFFLCGDISKDDLHSLPASCRLLEPAIESQADVVAQTRMDDLLFSLSPQAWR